MRVALRELPPRPQLLDIGTGDAALFERAGATGVGVDPCPATSDLPPGVTLLRGMFPDAADALPAGSFDAVTALAVFEHVPVADQPAWTSAIARLLAPNGVLVITVPSPAVDPMLHMLIRLRLAEGMEAHQHYGFRPSGLAPLFETPHWRQRKHRTFQFGLNHLYVFERTALPAAEASAGQVSASWPNPLSEPPQPRLPGI